GVLRVAEQVDERAIGSQEVPANEVTGADERHADGRLFEYLREVRPAFAHLGLLALELRYVGDHRERADDLAGIVAEQRQAGYDVDRPSVRPLQLELSSRRRLPALHLAPELGRSLVVDDEVGERPPDDLVAIDAEHAG